MSRWLGSSGSSELSFHAHSIHKPLLILKERKREWRRRDKVNESMMTRNTAASLKLAGLKVHTSWFCLMAPMEMSAPLTVPRKGAVITNTKWPQQDSHQGTRSIKMWQNNTQTNLLCTVGTEDACPFLVLLLECLCLCGSLPGLSQVLCLWSFCLEY